MAAFFHQMARHRETHHAETEKSDFRHEFYLVCFLGFAGIERGPGGVLEAGRPHHKPCAMKGNGFVWLTGRVLC
jgi:hypothetical protein